MLPDNPEQKEAPAEDPPKGEDNNDNNTTKTKLKKITPEYLRSIIEASELFNISALLLKLSLDPRNLCLMDYDLLRKAIEAHFPEHTYPLQNNEFISCYHNFLQLLHLKYYNQTLNIILEGFIAIAALTGTICIMLFPAFWLAWLFVPILAVNYLINHNITNFSEIDYTLSLIENHLLIYQENQNYQLPIVKNQYTKAEYQQYVNSLSFSRKMCFELIAKEHQYHLLVTDIQLSRSAHHEAPAILQRLSDNLSGATETLQRRYLNYTTFNKTFVDNFYRLHILFVVLASLLTINLLAQPMLIPIALSSYYLISGALALLTLLTCAYDNYSKHLLTQCRTHFWAYKEITNSITNCQKILQEKPQHAPAVTNVPPPPPPLFRGTSGENLEAVQCPLGIQLSSPSKKDIPRNVFTRLPYYEPTRNDGGSLSYSSDTTSPCPSPSVIKKRFNYSAKS